MNYKLVRQVRVRKCMTLDQIASQLDCSAQYVWMIEHGLKNPSIEMLKKIHMALGIEYDELLR